MWVYEDVANYACAGGYVPAGGTAPFASCQSDGTFSTVVSSCTPVDCGALVAPASGTVDTSSGTLLGASATYACNSGYNVVGATTRTCGSDGTWSGVAPSCDRITCTPPSPPANAQLSGGPYQYVSGEALTFSCDLGYQASGSLSRTCQLNGTYTALTGSCALVDCGALAAPSNGSSSGTGTTYQSERTFSCNAGYTATGAATRICQAAGTWSGTPFTCTDCNANPGEPECSSLDCGAAPAAIDGRSSLSSVSSTFLTGQATYTCDAASTTNGLPAGGTTYIRSCQSAGPTGAWSLPTATCQEVDCGTLSGSGALSVVTPDTTVDGVATYTCSAGYRLSGNATRTCTASGWSGTAPTCGALTCPAPASVVGGLVTPSSGGNAIASTATHSCNSATGYVTSGGTTGQTCVDDGNPVSIAGAWQWGGAPLQCSLRECPTYDVVNSTESATSAVGPNGRSVGSVVSFTCDAGYVVQGTSVASASRTCGTNGQWTGGLPVCVRRACDVLPGAPGTVSGGANYSYPAGYSTPVSTTSATYNCAAGSRIGGSPTGGTSASATCGDSGSWTAWSGTCQAVTCGTPPVAAGGSNSSRDAGWNAAPGGSATYTCTPGYSIDGAAASVKSYVATCVNGTGWQFPADATCEAFVCDALSNVTVSGGTAAVVSYQTAGGAPTASRAYGHRAIYNRQTGYRLLSGSTSTARTCEADGNWTGSVPTYERMQCPAITATGLAAAYRDGANALTTDRYVGYTASFACSVSGLTPTTGVQTCSETTDTNVRWEIPVGTGAPSVTCGNVNECTTTNACGEDTDIRNTCTDRTPTSSFGPGSVRFDCGCNAADGWIGSTVANSPATCDGQCGDGRVRGTEVCDDGTWNDRPWEGINGPGTPHPRYITDCEGVECDCVGPNASTTPSCVATGSRTICLDNGIPTAGLGALDCRGTGPTTAGRCGDGQDNDGDGRSDCADPGCSGKNICPNWNEPGCRHDYYLGNAQGSPVGQYLLTNDTAVSPDRFNVGFGSQEDVSFLWTAPYAGDWLFETCGGTRSFDTVMGAYSTNTCSSGGAPTLATNDDADASKATRQGCSVVVVRAEQNEPITIVVSAYAGNSGGTFPLVIYPSVNRSCGNGIVDGPIGMGVAATNRRVPDSRITASSYFDTSNRSHAPELGRLYQQNTFSNWSAGANNLSQWWQVDFQVPVTIGAIATQGRSTVALACAGDGCGQRVTEYRVQWSNDGVNFTNVTNSRADAYNPAIPTLFGGNADQDTPRYNYFTPTTARYWRVVPTAWVNHITMRVEFFTFAEQCDDANNANGDGCSSACVVEAGSSCFGGSPSACVPGATFACGDGVVETNGELYGPTRPNSAFSAANWWQFNNAPEHAPVQGRLDGPYAWAFAQGAAVGSTWWQMDLGSPQPVAGAVTQGRNDAAQWVTRYQVAYSNDGTNFTLVEGGRFFTGNNSSGPTRVFNRWAAITARYWRIIPQEYYGHMSMRADFFAPRYGYGATLPDSAFTAQSWFPNSQPGDSYAAHRGRLENSAGDLVWHPGSGVDVNTVQQWWQMDLGSPRPVGSVGTRGRANYDQWTSSYRVAYSNDGTNFTFVESSRVFAGNTNAHDVVFNGWAPISARFWRIYPVTWSWVPVLRADFFPALEVCDDGNLNNGDGCNSFCQVEQDWRCYGQPSICGGRRTVFNTGGLNTAANSGYFGFWWAGGSYGAPSDWRMGPYSLNSCDTITGVETYYTFAYPHYQASDLVSFVHNGATTNQVRGDSWFPIRQGGNNYRNHPSYEAPTYALAGGSTPSTMLNGRNGNSTQWYTQMSDYSTVQGSVGGEYGAQMSTMRLDVYCRCLAAITWYRDADGDGFGNPGVTQSSCAQPAGYVSNASDCDDGNGGVGELRWYRDQDQDGWTTAEVRVQCSYPGAGWVNAAGPSSPQDCNDATQWIYPGRGEICDGADNDCNPGTSEAAACSAAHLAPGTNSGGAGCVGRFNGSTNRGYMLCHASNNRDWNQHRSRCLNQGMDLALPNDPTESQWMRDIFVGWRNFGAAWIGIYRPGGIWTWVSNGSAIPWQGGWRSGEPSGDGPCVEFSNGTSGGADRRWNDLGCGNNRDESICEWNTENRTSP
jgi:cysteine-rich repeat protein